MIVTEPPSSAAAEALFTDLRKPELSRFLLRAKKAVGLQGDVTALLCGDTRIRQLNRDFRGKNKATDVLSFLAGENAGDTAGDLAISVETAAKQAARHGHDLSTELRVLMLHGMLHLAGFDHESDTGEMQQHEATLRDRFKLPGGLIERTLMRPKRSVASVSGSKSPVPARSKR